MKYLLSVLLYTIPMIGFCQLSYQDLVDLNIICKKGKFEAAKVFLTNNGYKIISDKEGYDHGSFFMDAEIEARKFLGTRHEYSLKNTEMDTIADVISIYCKSFDKYKELKIDKVLSTNQLFESRIKSMKYEILSSLEHGSWTNVDAGPLFYLGSRYSGLIQKDTLSKIENKTLWQYFADFKIKTSEKIKLSFLNENKAFGDLQELSVYSDHSSFKYKSFDPNSNKDSVTSHTYRLDISIQTKLDKQ